VIRADFERFRTLLISALLLTGVAWFPVQATAVEPEEEAGAEVLEAPARSAEDIAREAERTVKRHCSPRGGPLPDTDSSTATALAESWLIVSEALEQRRSRSLVYWRGVLAQCIEQEERAIDDFREFIAATEGLEGWTDLLWDARKRLRYLERRKKMAGGETTVHKPLLFTGIGLALASAGTGIGGGALRQRALQLTDEIYAEPHDSEPLEEARLQVEQQAQVSYALAGSSIGLGIASAVALLASTQAGTRLGSRASRALPPLIHPVPGGLAVGWTLRW